MRIFINVRAWRALNLLDEQTLLTLYTDCWLDQIEKKRLLN